MLPARKLAHLDPHPGRMNLFELGTYLFARADYLSPLSRRRRWGIVLRWLLASN